ncbi:MAG: hypothetical protein QXS04_02875 [Thermoproteota archaeon]
MGGGVEKVTMTSVKNVWMIEARLAPDPSFPWRCLLVELERE